MKRRIIPFDEFERRRTVERIVTHLRNLTLDQLLACADDLDARPLEPPLAEQRFSAGGGDG